MDLITARAAATEFMGKHGLLDKGWVFEFDRATSRLGQTNFSKRRVTISRHFTSAATPEEFMQTLYHEVAHALLPHFVKHGKLWQLKARELGYTGGRTSPNPYQTQLATKRRMANPHPAFAPDVVAGVMVAAEEATPRLDIGDRINLPNGTPLTVELMGNRKVQASDPNGAIWVMGTEDAAQYRQR